MKLKYWVIIRALVMAIAVTGMVFAQEADSSGTGEFGSYAASKDYTPPRDETVLKNLQKWQGQKLGLLISWGANSQWGIDSWPLCPERYKWNQRHDWVKNLPSSFTNDDRAYKKAYEDLLFTFKPTKFNPDKWAAAFKDGGVRYVLVMAKHHDGFSMFDTATTDYKTTSKHCPFHTDPRANAVREINSSLNRQGISVGIYFSKPDWGCPYFWNPDFPLNKGRNANYKPGEHPDLWKKFKDFTWKQIEELMTGYGPIDILWLDGGWVNPSSNHQDIDVTGMAAMARKHQPGLIVVDRCVKGENENYITPEQAIPSRLLPYPWETCMTMGTHWSFFPNEQYKSTATLIRNLCRIVARGGNYVLGIGANPDGEFDPTVYDRLREMGTWLKLNGEAIYDTCPVAPYEQSDCVFTRRRDGTVYAIMLSKNENSKPPATISLPAILTEKTTGMTLLGYGTLQPGETKDGQTTISIPEKARVAPPCEYAWTIKLIR
ncbi:MAG: alpha-L-fucosidase [Kiritimatiellae bacterium]|nr:alpha-L-fucosidase [Kiritimatiellia bacterium]